MNSYLLKEWPTLENHSAHAEVQRSRGENNLRKQSEGFLPMKQTDCKKLKTSESTNKILKGIEFLKKGTLSKIRSERFQGKCRIPVFRIPREVVASGRAVAERGVGEVEER